MAKTITSRPNIFGGTSHYDEHGKKIGESRPAIFGSTNHYDAKGHKIGYSRPGILSDDVQVHYDTHHNRVGTSRIGITGYENHYDNHGHKVGYTRENIFFIKHARMNCNWSFLEVKNSPFLNVNVNVILNVIAVFHGFLRFSHIVRNP